ncbi:DUF924 family protein [Dyella tabacisoli]|uniref:DUF924 domain-containing protein n=1 Tax=Dyella tabacisoli TaxID=2282381 RepID=A0A369UKT2_9GAMM|nr:DUF924 family protein [Dyella tabacisoli]RDD80328.1 DUF924 domain-containing protein [Dyella tabacisoli]
MLPTAQDVLKFWFDPASQAHWFARDDAFDEQIRTSFGAALEAAHAGALDDWARTPQGWLALLILLDQFSRNCHRNDPRAFAADSHAQALAMAGIERGDDVALEPHQRMFAYLPLEHAEDMHLQRRSVALFTALSEQAGFENLLDYAQRHYDVIARFGRFPHRNAVLGRIHTPAESEYLAQPGAGF